MLPEVDTTIAAERAAARSLPLPLEVTLSFGQCLAEGLVRDANRGRSTAIIGNTPLATSWLLQVARENERSRSSREVGELPRIAFRVRSELVTFEGHEITPRVPDVQSSSRSPRPSRKRKAPRSRSSRFSARVTRHLAVVAIIGSDHSLTLHEAVPPLVHEARSCNPQCTARSRITPEEALCAGESLSYASVRSERGATWPSGSKPDAEIAGSARTAQQRTSGGTACAQAPLS